MYIASYFVGFICIILGIYYFYGAIKSMKDKNVIIKENVLLSDKKVDYKDKEKITKMTIIQAFWFSFIFIAGGIFMMILVTPLVLVPMIILLVIVSAIINKKNKENIII